jgi:hypothetical protein
MDESLLQYYTKQWTRYTAAARVVNNIFMYLNRYWVKREIDEDRKSDVFDVFTVSKCLSFSFVTAQSCLSCVDIIAYTCQLEKMHV